MKINGVEIVDTFAEAFGMWASRVLITGINEQWAFNSASSLAGFGTSVIMCGCETAIERYVPASETPDLRPGIEVLIFATSFKGLEDQVFRRIGQCVMTSPTAACYNALDDKAHEKIKKFLVGGKIRFFGDGFQISKRPASTKLARRFWRIPIMEGEFLCEHEFNAQPAIGGGNFLIIGENIESVVEASEKAVEEVRKVRNVIAPFPGGVVRSGSKVGSIYKTLVASTNDAYAPVVKAISKRAELKENENCVLEIVVNGLDINSINLSMKKGIEAACTVSGITRISAGNYGGTLGKYQVHLRKLFA
jgi:formylmethanofuran--tetrahydromethanopterin N-formyltransferase